MKAANTYYIIPATDIYRIEQARKDLIELLPEAMNYKDITLSMYRLSHKKYPEATIWNSIKRWLL